MTGDHSAEIQIHWRQIAGCKIIMRGLRILLRELDKAVAVQHTSLKVTEETVGEEIKQVVTVLTHFNRLIDGFRNTGDQALFDNIFALELPMVG